MIDYTPLGRALADLTAPELAALQRQAHIHATAAADRGDMPRVVHLAHVCMVLLAEEDDRRRSLLDDAAAQLDPDHGAAGEIVTDMGKLIADARRELRTAPDSRGSRRNRKRRVKWELFGRRHTRPTGDNGSGSAP